MYKVSIIVPANGSQEDLDNTLVAILENRPEASEVIVAHPANYRDPYDLSDEVIFVPCENADVASLINAGVRASRAAVVHNVLSGVRVTDGWTEQPLAMFDTQSELAAVSPLILDARQSSRVASAGLGYRRSGTRYVIGAGAAVRSGPRNFQVDGPTLQAGFFRRERFLALGGFRAEFGTYHIDTDLTARLRAAKLACKHAHASRLEANPLAPPRGFRAGYNAERLYWDDARRQGVGRSIVQHAVHVAGNALCQWFTPMSACSGLIGRSWGLMRPTRTVTPGESPRALEAATTLPLAAATRPNPRSHQDGSAPSVAKKAA